MSNYMRKKTDFIAPTEDGKVPTPQAVLDDKTALEILRVWRHTDGTITHASMPRALEGPEEWGRVLAVVAQGFCENMASDAETATLIQTLLVKGFLSQLGEDFQILEIPNTQGNLGDLNRRPGVDPDPTKN